jgi:hypothetical protein
VKQNKALQTCKAKQTFHSICVFDTCALPAARTRKMTQLRSSTTMFFSSNSCVTNSILGEAQWTWSQQRRSLESDAQVHVAVSDHSSIHDQSNGGIVGSLSQRIGTTRQLVENQATTKHGFGDSAEWRHPSCQNLRVSTIWITRGHVQWLDASLLPAQIPWTLVPAHFVSVSSTSQSSRTRCLFHWTQSWSHPNRLGTRHGARGGEG